MTRTFKATSFIFLNEVNCLKYQQNIGEKVAKSFIFLRTIPKQHDIITLSD